MKNFIRQPLNLDFESWKKEHKDINNNLAVPSYRAFCKAYGINFHFRDEIQNFDPDKHATILLDEMPLHGKALSLFNFVNKPYHPFRDSIVSFAYTSWDDFEYEKISNEKAAKMLLGKDKEITKLETYFYTCYVVSLISIFALATLIFSNLIFSLLAIFVVGATPWIIYTLREKRELLRFDKKLIELKHQLKNMSDKYESK